MYHCDLLIYYICSNYPFLSSVVQCVCTNYKPWFIMLKKVSLYDYANQAHFFVAEHQVYIGRNWIKMASDGMETGRMEWNR